MSPADAPIDDPRPARAWVEDDTDPVRPESPDSASTQILPQVRARRAADPLPEEDDEASQDEAGSPEDAPAAKTSGPGRVGRRAWIEDADEDAGEKNTADEGAAERRADEGGAAEKSTAEKDSADKGTSPKAAEKSEPEAHLVSPDVARHAFASPSTDEPDRQTMALPRVGDMDRAGADDDPTAVRREPIFLAPQPDEEPTAPAASEPTASAWEDPATRRAVRGRLVWPVVALVIGLLAVAGCLALVLLGQLEQQWGLWVLLVAAGVAGGCLTGGVIGLIGWGSLRRTLRQDRWRPLALELGGGRDAVAHLGQESLPVELEKKSGRFGEQGQRVDAEGCRAGEHLVLALDERTLVLRTWPPRAAR